MKKNQVTFAILLVVLVSLSSCGPKCKKCYAEMLGTKSEPKEFCGEELKQVEASGMLKCE